MPADREEAGEGFPLTSTLNPEPRFPGVSFTDSRLVMKRKRAGRPYGGRSADLALQHDSWSHILTKRQKKR
jgi:hypothetical protein